MKKTIEEKLKQVESRIIQKRKETSTNNNEKTKQLSPSTPYDINGEKHWVRSTETQNV